MVGPIGENIREMLLPLTEEERVEILRSIDICHHCGRDERGKLARWACQCQNEE